MLNVAEIFDGKRFNTLGVVGPGGIGKEFVKRGQRGIPAMAGASIQMVITLKRKDAKRFPLTEPPIPPRGVRYIGALSTI